MLLVRVDGQFVCSIKRPLFRLSMPMERLLSFIPVPVFAVHLSLQFESAFAAEVNCFHFSSHRSLTVSFSSQESQQSSFRCNLPWLVIMNKGRRKGHDLFQVILPGTLTGVQCDIRCKVLAALSKVNNLSWIWPDRTKCFCCLFIEMECIWQRFPTYVIGRDCEDWKYKDLKLKWCRQRI